MSDSDVRPEDWYECNACGYKYDPKYGDVPHGVSVGTPFTELPEDWECPDCGEFADEFTNMSAYERSIEK